MSRAARPAFGTWSAWLATLPAAERRDARARAARSPDPDRYRARRLARVNEQARREKKLARDRKAARARRAIARTTHGLDARAIGRDLLRATRAAADSAGDTGVHWVLLKPAARPAATVGGFVVVTLLARFNPPVSIDGSDERFFRACEAMADLARSAPAYERLRPGPEFARGVVFDHVVSLVGLSRDDHFSVVSSVTRAMPEKRGRRARRYSASVHSWQYANLERGPAHLEGFLRRCALKASESGRVSRVKFRVFLPDGARLDFLRTRETDASWSARIARGNRRRGTLD